jgi:FtsZ-binding cell division protein ZapB
MYALNPFKTTPSTDVVQVLRESIEASIEELKEKEKSETDPLKKLSKTKIINELNTELDQIKSKTHKIQPTSN